MANPPPQADLGVTEKAGSSRRPTPLIELADADALPGADQALQELDNQAGAIGKGDYPPCTLIWRTKPALVVTKREARLPDFVRAASQMASAGWPVSVRGSGGGACAVGRGTVQIALVFPRPRDGVPLESVYAALAQPILSATSRFGIDAEVTPVPASFCSGRHDIAVRSRKIGGLAQQWRGSAGRGGYVIAAASIIVDEDPAVLAAAINSFSDLCDGVGRCCAGAITSLAREVGAPGGDADLTSRFSSRLRECARGASFEFSAA